jgi:HlyD family secretion protein
MKAEMRAMMKKRMLLILAVVAAVTASVAAYYRVNGSDGGPRLNTTPATRSTVIATVDATGTLEAVETVEVSTQVSGTIKALYADYNSRVRKGQVIAQLEPSLFETQVEQSRATVQRLQAEVEAAKVHVQDTALKLRRARELTVKQLIPATDLETAEANARQAEASLKAAEAQLGQGRASLNQTQVNLGHTTIVAPIDGIVISRNVDVGQTVAASMSAPTLFVLARDLTRMQVNAKIDEADIGRIQVGQTVSFGVDAYPGEPFTGSVKQVRLAPVVEQNVVSYVTVVDVPNPELKLKPGMTATVTVEVARADDALRVPNAALNFRPTAELFAALGQQVPEGRAVRSEGGFSRRTGRPGVWVLRDGRLRRVPVETSTSDGAFTAIVGGDLREGEQVVTGQAAQTAATSASRSPLLPQRPGGTRGGQGTRPSQGSAR